MDSTSAAGTPVSARATTFARRSGRKPVAAADQNCKRRPAKEPADPKWELRKEFDLAPSQCLLTPAKVSPGKFDLAGRLSYAPREPRSAKFSSSLVLIAHADKLDGIRRAEARVLTAAVREKPTGRQVTGMEDTEHSEERIASDASP